MPPAFSHRVRPCVLNEKAQGRWWRKGNDAGLHHDSHQDCLSRGCGRHHKPLGLRQWPWELKARYVDLMPALSHEGATAIPSLWGWCVVPGQGEADPFHPLLGHCLSRLPQSGCRVIFGRLSQQCTHVNDVWGVVSVGDLGARQLCKSAH